MQRIHLVYYLKDNSEFTERMYFRPASGRSLGSSLAAAVLGISERDSTLASISRVDHARLVDEFTRIDALDEGILLCPDVQESQRAQKPCKPTSTTPLSSPSASFSALLSDATTASTPQESSTRLARNAHLIFPTEIFFTDSSTDNRSGHYASECCIRCRDNHTRLHI